MCLDTEVKELQQFQPQGNAEQAHQSLSLVGIEDENEYGGGAVGRSNKGGVCHGHETSFGGYQ